MIYKLKCSFEKDSSTARMYTYAYEGDEVPKIGDQVLIRSTFYDGYALATVREAEETTADDVIGWVLIVQLLSHDFIRLEKEREIKLGVLRKQLDALKKQRVAEMELQELAGMSPEAKKLVDDFLAIGGVK